MDMEVFFLVCFLNIGFGFLLDTDAQGSVPSNHQPNHQYLKIPQFYEKKKEQRHRTTELYRDKYKLRNSMEHDFALMRTQFKKQLQILEQKIQSDGVTHSEILQNIKNSEQKYRDLEAYNNELRNEISDLLTKFTKQEQELQSIRIKILETEEETEKLLKSTDARFASQENKTAEHRKEISEVKQFKNIKTLDDLRLIKQELQSVATETHSLILNEHTRNQDVLALYNKTTYIEQLTNHKIENHHNMTESKFNQLQSHQTTRCNTLNQKLLDLKHQSETMEKETLANLNKEVMNIQMNVNMALAQLEQQINDNTKKVAVTSCVSRDTTYNPGTLIKFDDVRTSIGIKNISAFITSGNFSCEVNGLYHISVYLASSTSGSTYSIYKNSNKLITTYTMNYGYLLTSTGVVVVEMNVGDTISVAPDHIISIYEEQWSCITIAMIK